MRRSFINRIKRVTGELEQKTARYRTEEGEIVRVNEDNIDNLKLFALAAGSTPEELNLTLEERAVVFGTRLDPPPSRAQPLVIGGQPITDEIVPVWARSRVGVNEFYEKLEEEEEEEQPKIPC